MSGDFPHRHVIFIAMRISLLCDFHSKWVHSVGSGGQYKRNSASPAASSFSLVELID